MHGEYVYVLRAGEYYKIGRTSDFGKRIAQLKIQLPFEVELFKVINTNDSTKLEAYFHRLYANLRANGEWFKLTPQDAVMLSLYPCSVDCKDIHSAGDAYSAALQTMSDALEQRARDAALEKLIKEEAEIVFDDIPENWGGAAFADYLEHECPYPPDANEIEWVVPEDSDGE